MGISYNPSKHTRWRQATNPKMKQEKMIGHAISLDVEFFLGI
jgi:hypothetical protein